MSDGGKERGREEGRERETSACKTDVAGHKFVPTYNTYVYMYANHYVHLSQDHLLCKTTFHRPLRKISQRGLH